MKKISYVILALIFSMISVASYANAQSAKTQGHTHSTKAKTSKKYYCTKCGFSSTKTGKCPMDKSELVKDGTYYCESCGTRSNKAGKCPACHKEMTKMDGSKRKSGMNSPKM